MCLCSFNVIMDRSFDLVTLLKNHEQKYKHKHTLMTNMSTGIQKRLEKNMKHRKSSRLSVFDRIRNLPSNEDAISNPLTEKQKKIEHRKLQLQQWKEEKEKKKKEAASKKKKPFVIGISHPSLKYVPPPAPPRPVPSMSGRITRSQTRANSEISHSIAKPCKSDTAHSFAPKNAVFNPDLKIKSDIPNFIPKKGLKKINIAFEPMDSQLLQKRCTTENKTDSKVNISKEKNSDKRKGVKKSKPPSLKTLQSSSSQSDEDLSRGSQATNKTPRKCIIANSMVTPKNKTLKSESSSEERLRSKSTTESVNCSRLSGNNKIIFPMTPDQIPTEVKHISPNITLSRGKDKARRETMLKMAEGLLDDDNCNIENVEYFSRQLDSEVGRITEMCDTWEKMSQQLHLSDTIQELVLAAVGQARLLVSQKLAQFGSLVRACACPEPGAALVTPKDLHGFWDMVFMQIEDVDIRFKKLEDIRACNWVEEVPILQKKRMQKPVKKSVKPAATSRMRELIAAARKAKKEQQVSSAGCKEQQQDAEVDSKTFDAGFFCVSSPVKSPVTTAPVTARTTLTPAGSERDLLKAVLSSEVKKASANSASLAMMRASILSKNIETENISMSQHESGSITPVTLGTPGRSILKSGNKLSTKKKSGKKSIKVVLFDSTYTETQESKEDGVLIIKGAKRGDKAEIESNSDKDNRKDKLHKDISLDERSPVMTRIRRKLGRVSVC